MNAEQFGRLMAELQEIKALLTGKAEQEANEPMLRWWKGCGDYWWAGPAMKESSTAVYCTQGIEYYAGGGANPTGLVSLGMAKDAPLAFAVGVILGHAATNGIRIEPFPWHLINEEE